MSEAMDSAVDNSSKSEQLSDGRFEYTHLYKYLRDGTYPEGGWKEWQTGEVFLLRKGAIYTTLAANPVSACMHDSYQCTIHMTIEKMMKLVVEDVQKLKRILTNAHDSGHLCE